MKTIQLKISGMTCGACVGHVTQALQNVPGVQSAVVDLAAAQAVVTGESLDSSLLVAAVEEEGYGASEVSGESDARPSGAPTIPLTEHPLTEQGCSCCG